MKKLGIIRQTIKNLWSCERGAVAPLVGVCAIMMVGAVAVAVDVGRGQVAQSKLQAALDSAGLAAGAVVSQSITEEELKPEAWKYLLENFNGATVDATITVDDFDLVLSDDDHLVTLEARASLPTTFMRIFGHDIMHVAARTEITREMTGLEVAVVLDVTGSMCDPCSKRDAMKAGATDLIEIMFGDNATVDDLWIGIVPFSQGVNIGTGRTDWLSDWAARSAQDNCIGWNHANWSHTHTVGENPRFCPTNNANVSTRTWPLTLVDDWMFSSNAGWYFSPHGWGGCVEARETDDEDVTDTPPSDAKFPTYFAPDTSSSGGNDWRTSSGGYNVNTSGTRSANRNCPQNAITPLTNVKQTLLDAIADINVQGYTQMPLGAAWGWRLLSPNWRGEWGGDMDTNDLPLDYDAPLTQKVVIFMTDGNNDMPDEGTDPNMYTAYGRIGDGRIDGITEDSAAEDEMDARFTQICNAMKATDAEEENVAGITIYTISFGADVTTASKNLLKNCASLQDYYFHAPTEEKLQDVFHAIGDALSKLRVSK